MGRDWAVQAPSLGRPVGRPREGFHRGLAVPLRREQEQAEHGAAANAGLVAREAALVSEEMDHVLTLVLGEQDTDQRRIAKLWRTYNPRGAYFRGGHRPAFFKKLAFAQDSGFSDIPNLTDPQSSGGVSLYVRFVSAVLLASFVVYNIVYLIQSDLDRLPEACRNHTHQGFLLSRFLTQKLFRMAGWEISWTTISCQEKLAGYLELVGLVVLLSRVARNIFIAAFPYYYIHYATVLAYLAFPKYAERRWSMGHDEDDESQERWCAMTRIFFQGLPQISCYSGMKLLHFLQPWVITKDLCSILYNGPAGDVWWRVPEFIILRVLFFVVGFDLFCVRFRATWTSVSVTDEELTFQDLVRCVLFVKQVLGIVQVDVLVRERLLLFIFAGEDSVLNSEERSTMMVWHAMVAEEIWIECTAKSNVFGIFKFLVIMMSWSDEDVQKLVLEVKTDHAVLSTRGDAHYAPSS